MPRSLATARREVHIDAVVLGLVAVWIVGFGAAAGWLARKRHRAVAVWVAIGAVTGPIALLLLERAPLGRCPNCDATVHGWATVCVWCGGDVRHAGGVVPAVVAPAPAPPAGRPTVAASAAAAPTASAPKADRRRPTTTIAERAATSRPVAPAPPATTPAPDTADAPPTTASSPDTAGAPAAVPAPPTATVPAPPPPKPRARRTTSKARDTAAATGAGAPPPAKRSTRSRKAPAPAIVAAAPADYRTLASAVFVTGSVGFQPGSWYTLETNGTDLRVLGPLERDARAIALSRPVGPLDASAVNGRLVVNGADGLVMVFMRMAGMSAEDVAELIARADGDTGAER